MHIEPQRLLNAIKDQQMKIVTAESINAERPALSGTHRTHARAAVAWAEADLNLVECHEDVLLAAME
jgi:hypothetical protein